MITGLYAAILGIIFLILSYNIILKRLKFGIGIGFEKSHILEKAVRVHGNFAEYVPLALLLILICELNTDVFSGGGLYHIHGLGLALVIARIAHAVGLTQTSVRSMGRSVGVILTHLVILVAAGILIYQYFI